MDTVSNFSNIFSQNKIMSMYVYIYLSKLLIMEFFLNPFDASEHPPITENRSMASFPRVSRSPLLRKWYPRAAFITVTALQFTTIAYYTHTCTHKHASCTFFSKVSEVCLAIVSQSVVLYILPE